MMYSFMITFKFERYLFCEFVDNVDTHSKAKYKWWKETSYGDYFEDFWEATNECIVSCQKVENRGSDYHYLNGQKIELDYIEI